MRSSNSKAEIEILIKSDSKLLEYIFENIKNTSLSMEVRICGIKTIKALIQTCAIARRCIIELGFCTRGGVIYSLLDFCVAENSRLSSDENLNASNEMLQLGIHLIIFLLGI